MRHRDQQGRGHDRAAHLREGQQRDPHQRQGDRVAALDHAVAEQDYAEGDEAAEPHQVGRDGHCGEERQVAAVGGRGAQRPGGQQHHACGTGPGRSGRRPDHGRQCRHRRDQRQDVHVLECALEVGLVAESWVSWTKAWKANSATAAPTAMDVLRVSGVERHATTFARSARAGVILAARRRPPSVGLGAGFRTPTRSARSLHLGGDEQARADGRRDRLLPGRARRRGGAGAHDAAGARARSQGGQARRHGVGHRPGRADAEPGHPAAARSSYARAPSGASRSRSAAARSP